MWEYKPLLLRAKVAIVIFHTLTTQSDADLAETSNEVPRHTLIQDFTLNLTKLEQYWKPKESNNDAEIASLPLLCLVLYAEFIREEELTNETLAMAQEIFERINEGFAPVPTAGICVVVEAAIDYFETWDAYEGDLLMVKIWHIIKLLTLIKPDNAGFKKHCETLEALMEVDFPFYYSIPLLMQDGKLHTLCDSLEESSLDRVMIDEESAFLKSPKPGFFVVIDKAKDCMIPVHMGNIRREVKEMLDGGKVIYRKISIVDNDSEVKYELEVDDFDWWNLA